MYRVSATQSSRLSCAQTAKLREKYMSKVQSVGRKTCTTRAHAEFDDTTGTCCAVPGTRFLPRPHYIGPYYKTTLYNTALYKTALVAFQVVI